MKTRLTHMFKKYGKVAIGVHLTVYATSFLGTLGCVASEGGRGGSRNRQRWTGMGHQATSPSVSRSCQCVVPC